MLSGQPAQEALLRLSGASEARLPYCLTSQSAQFQDFYYYAAKRNECGVAAGGTRLPAERGRLLQDARFQRSCLPGASTAQADRDTSVFDEVSLREAVSAVAEHIRAEGLSFA